MTDSKDDPANSYQEMSNLKWDFRNYNLYHMIASKVKGDCVLDIGCGNGFLLALLCMKKKKLYGIEPNKDLIRLAKEINPHLYIEEGYAEDIDKIDALKRDCISMIDVLEHIKDDDAQIQKIYTHLSDGGEFIVVVPAYQFLYGKKDKNAGHYRRYSKKDLIKKLSNKRFKVKLIRYWNVLGFFPYLFSEKILRRVLHTELRTIKKKGFIKKLINRTLNLWFKYIENNFNFRFGLSIICIAEKQIKSKTHFKNKPFS